MAASLLKNKIQLNPNKFLLQGSAKFFGVIGAFIASYKAGVVPRQITPSRYFYFFCEQQG